MEQDIAPAPPELTADLLEAAQNALVLFGMDVSRSLVAVMLALTFFYIGVVISQVVRLNGDATWAKVLAASVPIALLTTPATAKMVAERTFGADIPLLDQVVALVRDADPLSASLFWFGVIVVIGMLSWHLLRIGLVLAHKLLGVVEKSAGARIDG